MPLPTINLPSPVSLPAVAAQTVQAAFVPSLTINADPSPSKPWPMSATLRGVDANGYVTDPTTGKFVDHVCNRDLRADSATLPTVAQVMGGVLTVIPLLAALDVVEKQIAAGLADIALQTKSLADSAADITKFTTAVNHWTTTTASGNTTADQIAKWLVSAQTALATATTAQNTAAGNIVVARELVWVTLLGNWRMAANPLGVTDIHALPPQLVGLTAPDGVTI